MKTILELSHIKARQYFLESQNYCNMQFPKYIDFKPVIEYVQNSVGNKELRDILKDPKRMPSDYENVNHKMLVKKDAQYSYRPIQLINPYLYYLLVKAMTNKSKRLLNYILCIRFFIEVHSIVSASRFFHMPTYLRVVIECQSRFFPFFPAFSRNCPDYFLHTSGSSSFRSLSDLGAR